MSQARILVVEDDHGLREAIVDTLLLAGYACQEADSAEAALLQLGRQSVDMVISDIQMGGMDGHTLLSNIRLKYSADPGAVDDRLRQHRWCGPSDARRRDRLSGQAVFTESPAQSGQPLCAAATHRAQDAGVR